MIPNKLTIELDPDSFRIQIRSAKLLNMDPTLYLDPKDPNPKNILHIKGADQITGVLDPDQGILKGRIQCLGKRVRISSIFKTLFQ